MNHRSTPCSSHPRWRIPSIRQAATAWLAKQRSRHRGASEKSPWWDFVYGWPRDTQSWLEDFIAGRHRFSPRIRDHFQDETPDVWE